MRKIIRRIKCLVGKHGNPIGTFQLMHYDVHQRIFRYSSGLMCPFCKKEMK